MRIGSADYLRLLVRTGGHIEVDPEFPHGYRTRTLITIKAADAPDGLELKTPAGYRVDQIELPADVLEDFIHANFVRGPERVGRKLIYQLTEDGIEHGKPKPEAA
jgi:hypothetical protein